MIMKTPQIADYAPEGDALRVYREYHENPNPDVALEIFALTAEAWSSRENLNKVAKIEALREVRKEVLKLDALEEPQNGLYVGSAPTACFIVALNELRKEFPSIPTYEQLVAARPFLAQQEGYGEDAAVGKELAGMGWPAYQRYLANYAAWRRNWFIEGEQLTTNNTQVDGNYILEQFKNEPRIDKLFTLIWGKEWTNAGPKKANNMAIPFLLAINHAILILNLGVFFGVVDLQDVYSSYSHREPMSDAEGDKVTSKEYTAGMARIYANTVFIDEDSYRSFNRYINETLLGI